MTSTRSHRSRSAKASAARNGLTFDDVAAIALALPGTEETTAYGGRCLKVNGRHFTGIAVNKSAEPNSLIIRISPAERDVMIEEQPDVYYTADHYENYDCVLVRLARVNRDVLTDLLRMSHRFIAAKGPARRRSTATRKRRKPTRR